MSRLCSEKQRPVFLEDIINFKMVNEHKIQCNSKIRKSRKSLKIIWFPSSFGGTETAADQELSSLLVFVRISHQFWLFVV